MSKLYNKIQAAPDSAMPAIAHAVEYINHVYAAQYQAREDTSNGHRDEAGIRRSFHQAEDELRSADPKNKLLEVDLHSLGDMVSSTENMSRESAKRKLLEALIGEEYASPLPANGFDLPTSYEAFSIDNKVLYLRSDVKDVLEQMISGDYEDMSALESDRVVEAI